MALMNITILRALNGLGDFLCATPALRALRHHFAEARISYIGLPPDHAIAQRYRHLIDRFVPFPGFPGIPEQPFEMNRLMAFLDDVPMQAEIDLAIQMHGSGTVSNTFVALLGARDSAGFHLPHLWCPDPETYLPYPDDLPEPERWLVLARHLGAEGEPGFDLPIRPADRAKCAQLMPSARRYALLHPGASQAERRWPARYFAIVGDALAARGLTVVLTGVDAERGVTRAVAAAMTAPALDLAGQTDLGAMAALVESAELVVTNDTGTSHMAAATRTPSVVLFIGSDRARWAPIDRLRHRAVGGGWADAMPGRVDRRGRAAIPGAAEALAAADALLERAA